MAQSPPTEFRHVPIQHCASSTRFGFTSGATSPSDVQIAPVAQGQQSFSDAPPTSDR